MIRKHYNSGTPWEPVAGYSRAVRVGNQVFVSGT
ncbi:MAG TPA: RidA family protein, partial [Anaerolineae bacterium]|nr:RidA family protein [Anaerolineae bacterium]